MPPQATRPRTVTAASQADAGAADGDAVSALGPLVTVGAIGAGAPVYAPVCPTVNAPIASSSNGGNSTGGTSTGGSTSNSSESEANAVTTAGNGGNAGHGEGRERRRPRRSPRRRSPRSRRRRPRSTARTTESRTTAKSAAPTQVEHKCDGRGGRKATPSSSSALASNCSACPFRNFREVRVVRIAVLSIRRFSHPTFLHFLELMPRIFRGIGVQATNLSRNPPLGLDISREIVLRPPPGAPNLPIDPGGGFLPTHRKDASCVQGPSPAG